MPHTCVPAQTGGTANGSLVDEKEKSDHRSAHPTNRAVTSQPTAMHNRSTELLQAELSCQKADQPCCYKPTNRAIKSPNPNNRRCYKPTKRVVHCKRKSPINSRKTQNFREFIIRCDTTFGSLSGEIPISHALPPIYV